MIPKSEVTAMRSDAPKAVQPTELDQQNELLRDIDMRKIAEATTNTSITQEMVQKLVDSEPGSLRNHLFGINGQNRMRNLWQILQMSLLSDEDKQKMVAGVITQIGLATKEALDENGSTKVFKHDITPSELQVLKTEMNPVVMSEAMEILDHPEKIESTEITPAHIAAIAMLKINSTTKE